MMRVAALCGWTSEQKHVVAASFLGWSLDAFSFFPAGVRAQGHCGGVRHALRRLLLRSRRKPVLTLIVFSAVFAAPRLASAKS